jgi:hypothetical protein
VTSGKEIDHIKTAKAAEVFDQGVYALLDLWSPPFRPAQIRGVPYLLQGTGLQGRDSRGAQGELVERKEANYHVN